MNDSFVSDLLPPIPCKGIRIARRVCNPRRAFFWGCRREELTGIHVACAAANAGAQLAGHPVVALAVARAMSRTLLAVGYQANRITALAATDALVRVTGAGGCAYYALHGGVAC